eukprot:TRINITY_DN1185_c0_g1_i2.p1 TRINITY_DN1185_c0_g1~~TRINITY_DN1185_c0_g1_i2.p1  ORF type:complete len:401 (+),score=119.14 TRINITY_DN1185_c0_g1_i2:62-1204(+)
MCIRDRYQRRVHGEIRNYLKYQMEGRDLASERTKKESPLFSTLSQTSSRAQLEYDGAKHTFSSPKGRLDYLSGVLKSPQSIAAKLKEERLRVLALGSIKLETDNGASKTQSSLSKASYIERRPILSEDSVESRQIEPEIVNKQTSNSPQGEQRVSYYRLSRLTNENEELRNEIRQLEAEQRKRSVERQKAQQLEIERIKADAELKIQAITKEKDDEIRSLRDRLREAEKIALDGRLTIEKQIIRFEEENNHSKKSQLERDSQDKEFHKIVSDLEYRIEDLNRELQTKTVRHRVELGLRDARIANLEKQKESLLKENIEFSSMYTNKSTGLLISKANPTFESKRIYQIPKLALTSPNRIRDAILNERNENIVNYDDFCPKI